MNFLNIIYTGKNLSFRTLVAYFSFRTHTHQLCSGSLMRCVYASVSTTAHLQETWCLVCRYTKSFPLLQGEKMHICVTNATKHWWGNPVNCHMLDPLTRTWKIHQTTVEDNESVVTPDQPTVWAHRWFVFQTVRVPGWKQWKMRHFFPGEPSFFFWFVWIQNCHFLSDETQRTNKDEKCSKSASKHWPSSADTVVRSSHVGIIFCTEGDVLIKHLFITRSVPMSKVPSCSIMPEKTHG